MTLYYHKTDGGAEYLCSNPVKGTTEGSFKSDYIIRIDGDIRKDAELIIKSPETSLNYKEQLTLFLSDLRHTLVKYWLDNKDEPTFNPRPYKIISNNITSIEKNISKL